MFKLHHMVNTPTDLTLPQVPARMKPCVFSGSTFLPTSGKSVATGALLETRPSFTMTPVPQHAHKTHSDRKYPTNNLQENPPQISEETHHPPCSAELNKNECPNWTMQERTCDFIFASDQNSPEPLPPLNIEVLPQY